MLSPEGESHSECQSVSMSAAAGGRAQAGIAWAADGKEAGSTSVLSVLGAVFLKYQQEENKHASLCPLYFLAFKLLPLFTQGHGLRKPQLPSLKFCLHKSWSYSGFIFQLQRLKKI